MGWINSFAISRPCPNNGESKVYVILGACVSKNSPSCYPRVATVLNPLVALWSSAQCPNIIHKAYDVFVQSVVLPRVMEQVIQCKDNIAQQYLMQCIIQGFPDEFHVSTLDVLLAALPELQGAVKVHIILASMLDRLARSVQCTADSHAVHDRRFPR